MLKLRKFKLKNLVELTTLFFFGARKTGSVKSYLNFILSHIFINGYYYVFLLLILIKLLESRVKKLKRERKNLLSRGRTDRYISIVSASLLPPRDFIALIISFIPPRPITHLPALLRYLSSDSSVTSGKAITDRLRRGRLNHLGQIKSLPTSN